MRSPLVTLLEPPLFDCRAPHLGCPTLVAALRHAGFRARFRDLNLEAVLWLLDQSRLDAAARAVQARGFPSRDLRAARCRLGIDALARDAIATLRGPGFYDSRRHFAARRVLNTAVGLRAYAADPRLYVNLCPQEFNGPHRATSVRGLLDATRDEHTDLFRTFFEGDVLPGVLADDPTLVGVSISNVFQVIPGVSLAGALHRAGAYVAIGGPLFSRFSSEIASHPAFFELCDVVVLGDGEQTLPLLAAAVANGRALHDVPNVLFDEGGRVVATQRMAASLDCDEAADFRDLELSAYLSPSPVLPIEAGRGCAWSRCTFCEITSASRTGDRRRCRQPVKVVEEMCTQRLRHGAHHFVFTDEALEPALAREIAGEITRRELEVNWLGYARLSSELDDKLCRSLARGGCRKLLFGLESGSQRVNDRCRKGVDLADVPRVIDACQDAGIAVHIFAIAGLPGEGRTENEESTEYLRSLARSLDTPLSTMDVGAFQLNWNSWLRRNAEREGIVYRTAHEFPLHADDYSIAGGMDAHGAQVAARAMQSAASWEASALGFDIGYLNPVWPGWEEYTLLYLSSGNAAREAARRAWPTTTAALLERRVEVVAPLEIHPSGAGRATALSPAADPVETASAVLAKVCARREHRVGQLADACTAAPGSEDARADALAEVASLIHAGVLQW